MERPSQTTRKILSPLNCTPSNMHFKPLWHYTMAAVPCADNHKSSMGLLRSIPSLFSNMPVGMVENIPPKRKFDDSCLDDSYETPAKKPYIPSTSSPDLGLGCDSFNFDTPNSVSQQSLLKRRKAVRYPTKDAIAGVKINLHLSSSDETGVVLSDGTQPNGVTSSPKTGILTPEIQPDNRGDFFVFDKDLCLSPISNEESDIVVGRLCPRHRDPPSPNSTAGQRVAKGTLKEEPSTDWAREGCKSSSSATSANTVTVGSDGPLSRHSLQFLSTGSGSSHPLVKKPFPLPKQVHTAPPSGNWDLTDKLCNACDALGDITAPVKALEGISEPNFASDDSFEDSLHLQLQSVVVVKSHASGSSTSPALLPDRPVAFISERDWNHKKRLYVDSVLRHIQQPCGPDGPMSQLLNLMGHVAEQHRWQHPTDLSARNHQQRFGNVNAGMSLSEWKARSSRNHQGFSWVPAMFHRSPVP